MLNAYEYSKLCSYIAAFNEEFDNRLYTLEGAIDLEQFADLLIGLALEYKKLGRDLKGTL